MHDWIDRFGLRCCRGCGIVKRADGENKPCPGPVRVALRQNRIASDINAAALQPPTPLSDRLADERSARAAPNSTNEKG